LVIHVTGASGSQDRRRSLERLRFLVPFNESHTVPVEHFAVPGEAGTAIAEHANRLHADLVVLGSPLNELKEEDFHSSTVLQVISNVNCPVLCVPPPQAISTGQGGMIVAKTLSVSDSLVGEVDEHSLFERLIQRCEGREAFPVAVCWPCSTLSLAGAMEAARAGIIRPMLVGPV